MAKTRRMRHGCQSFHAMHPTSSIQVRSHVLRDVRLEGWEESIAGKWHYRDLAADPVWCHGWISFDAVSFNPSDACIYCGLNAIDGDLLYRFDPSGGGFSSLNTRRWTDAFDAKIHRTLLRNPADDCFYFATSLLHDVDQQTAAPGGKLVRYDWKSDVYTTLAIPVPPLYVQSIALDAGRGIIYGFTYPAELLFRHDLRTRQTRVLACLGNALALAQPHNAVIDAAGWLWGTCAETRAWDERPGPVPIRLFKYHPDSDRFVWFDFGLSRRSDTAQLGRNPSGTEAALPDMTESRHKADDGVCDSMCYDGSRYIYAGTVAGVLCRIDTQTDRVEKIANVMASGRFPALGFGPDGLLYGGGGMKGRTELCRLSPETFAIEVWGNLQDPACGDRPARIHELAVDDKGTVWFGENDNHRRSSRLWSAVLPASR